MSERTEHDKLLDGMITMGKAIEVLMEERARLRAACTLACNFDVMGVTVGKMQEHVRAALEGGED
jgi:hypothetical protein